MGRREDKKLANEVRRKELLRKSSEEMVADINSRVVSEEVNNLNSSGYVVYGLRSVIKMLIAIYKLLDERL